MIPRRPIALSLSLALAVAVLATARPAAAQTYAVKATTARVEEDWKVVVNGDASADGPQLMFYMSPVSDESQPYAWLMLNLVDEPNPSAVGGFMVQVWDYSDHLLASCTGTNIKELNTTGETINWTSRMALSKSSGQITFDILNGKCSTWGDWAKQLTPISFNGPTTLAGYSPYVSAKLSRAGFMANNVVSMTLLTVRQYDAGGKLIQTDNLNLAVNLSGQ